LFINDNQVAFLEKINVGELGALGANNYHSFVFSFLSLIAKAGGDQL